MKENYIKIEPFMIKGLGLGGSELLVFAIIHGFTKVSGSYNGGYKYMMREFGLGRTSIYYSLCRLKSSKIISIKRVGSALEIVSNIDSSKVQSLNNEEVQGLNTKGSRFEHEQVQGLNKSGSRFEHKNTIETNKKLSRSYARAKNSRPRAEPEPLDFDSKIDVSDYSLPFEF